jgi:hypothetical protein
VTEVGVRLCAPKELGFGSPNFVREEHVDVWMMGYYVRSLGQGVFPYDVSAVATVLPELHRLPTRTVKGPGQLGLVHVHSKWSFQAFGELKSPGSI